MIWDKKGLPIVVGGTGLYVQGVTDGIGTASIPRDSGLREKLEEREVDELYEQLAQLDPIKAASLNTSDKKNPRRLIRAIEVAQWGVKGKKKRRRIGTEPLKKVETLFVGLKGEREKLCKRVEKRVNQRLEAGIKGEIEKLLDSGVSWDSQAMISLGYKHWRGYFEKDEKQEDVLKKWKNDECQYAKRQMTWFKKDKRVVWYDIFSDEYPDSVEKSVKKWYKER
jgi:tRNA dimethylallyltransferase